MPSPSLKGLCLEQIVGSADRFLDLQWSDGRFEVEPERATEVWNQFHQQYILAATLLYTLDVPGNPWHQSPRLWEAILCNGRFIAGQVDSDGTMVWNMSGQNFRYVCQRLLCAFLLAYEMLEGRLPAEDEEAWRGSILRGSEWLWERHIVPHRETRRFTAHKDGVGTGTNHFALYLSLFTRVGKRFDRSEWVEGAADLMRRLIAAQEPGGYWPEHHGPAVGYDALTYHGVDEYTAWSGDSAGIRALRAGLGFHKHWTYPDGTPVECIDGRMRHLSQPVLWGLAGFSRWPDGRGYVRAILERIRGLELGGEGVAKLAEAYLMLHEGEEETPPQRKESYRAVLDGVSVIRKEGPWVAALSGQCSPNWEDNVFILDRQALVSVWREGLGLVLDGSNSKHQSELAMLCRGSGPSADCVPLEAELLPGEREEGVRLRYATFEAVAQMRITDHQTVDVWFRVPTREGPERVTATIVPAVNYGQRITLDFWGPTREIQLGDEAFAIQMPEYGSTLSYPGVRILLPGGARVEYPVSPFNSYTADNTSPPGANRLVVRCPVDRGGIAFRIQARQ